jgi:hypothetical protein
MSDLWLPEGPHWDLNIEHHPLKGGTGSFDKGGWKLVAHTTEPPDSVAGFGFETLDSVDRQFLAGGGTPHLAVGYRKGFRFPSVYQYLPFDEYAKTLEHPGGTPETNRANAIQVEICGRAAQSGEWGENYYKALANVYVLISRRTHVPLRLGRRFRNTDRFTPQGWIDAKGLVGHMHAPNQPQRHSDPGVHFKGSHLVHLAKQGRHELAPRH